MLLISRWPQAFRLETPVGFRLILAPMKFDPPLKRGRLIKRYKRFLADIEMDSGEVITASCPNTGTMMGLSAPGMGVWVSESDSETRKYRHSLQIVEHDLGDGPCLVGINTHLPNRLVSEALEARRVKALAGYESLKREQKYGKNSRIDILLEDPRKGRCFVEIKNVHLMRKAGLAEFPDSVTARGAKHLDELGDMVEAGHRAVMVYLVQRADAKRFKLAEDLDPAYAAAFHRARERGVEAIALNCDVTPQGIDVLKSVRVQA